MKIQVKNRKGEWKEREFHFFCSTGAVWTADNDMRVALERCVVADNGTCEEINVFRVPGPDTRKYGINWFQPQVRGIVYVGAVNNPKFKKRR